MILANKQNYKPIITTMLIAILLFFSGLALFTGYLLKNIEQQVRQQAVNALQTVLSSTHTAIRDVWLNERLTEIKVWASNPQIIQSTEQLLTIAEQLDVLSASPEQVKIRSYFKDRLEAHGDFGMFIIAPNFNNLSSMRDTNIGTINLVAQESEILLKKVFSGNTEITNPLRSDIPLPDLKGNLIEARPTMFIISPIKNENGAVIAALSIRLDPFANLSDIALKGQIGLTGETYLFDRKARLVSESRFADSLRDIGLIEEKQSSILNVSLRDPGVNLIKGDLSNLPRDKLPLTLMAINAIEGNAGFSLQAYNDYRGVPVLGAWLWDDKLDMGFASEMDEDEAIRPFSQQRILLLSILVGFVLFTFALVAFIFRIQMRSASNVHRSEQYLRSIMENAADAIITMSEFGIVESFNSAAERMFQYRVDEIIGDNIRILMPEPYKTNHDHFLENYRKTGIKKIIGIGREIEARRKDGSLFPMRLAVSEAFVNNQRIFTGVIQDLTKIKASEKALRESEDKFRHFFEDSRDAIIIIDEKGIVDCNTSAVAMFAMDNKVDLLHKELFQLSPPVQPGGKNSKIAMNEYYSLAMTKKNKLFEWTCIRDDVNEFPVEMSLSFIELASRPLVQAVIRDITKRKRVDSNLKEQSTELIRTVSELHKSRTAALSMMQDATNEKHRAQKAQQALDYRVQFENLISELSTRFISLKIENIDQGIEEGLEKLASFAHTDSGYVFLFSEDNKYFSMTHLWCNDLLKTVKSTLQNLEVKLMPWWMKKLQLGEAVSVDDIKQLGQEARLEKEILLAQGIKTIIDVPMAFENRIIGFVGFSSTNSNHQWNENDIALLSMAGQMIANALHRQQTEQALVVEKNKADEASRAKSDFLARMSHEIRTPMNAIMGMTYLALKQDLSPKIRNYLDKTNQSATALLGIINDILDFSKIEAGKLMMEQIDFELENVISNVMNLVSMDADKKNLEIIIDIAPDVPINLVGDPLRLGQILTNIINNAVKFTESGEILISICFIEQALENEISLQFIVKDTGIGMTQSQVSSLFQAFSQADGSTTRKYGGTGLGLAICQRLVDMMGGHIEVESKLDEGSCFKFSANFGKSIEQNVSSLKALSSVNLQGLKCLVVDDNIAAQQVLDEMIQSMGFVVQCVASGELALQALEEANPKDPFKLAIVDWKMPGMDGIETIKKIKNSKSLKTIPACLMVSIYSHEEIVKKSEDIEIEAFLEKPVRPSTLFNSINEIFSNTKSYVKLVDQKFVARPEIENNIKGRKVLLVEDNPLNQELAIELLQQVGVDVTLACNGIEAIEQQQNTNFDLVLMDIQMPLMDGLEATRKIRALEDKTDPVPIVAMTANAMAGDREKSLSAGMNDHLNKPIMPEELYKMLFNWIKTDNDIESQLVEKIQAHSDKVTENFAELPGINVEIGLKLSNFDPDFFNRNLIRFARHGQHSFDEFIKAYENLDLLEIKRYAHSMKSSAAQIGAEDLKQVAQTLETAIQDGSNIEDIKPIITQYEKEFQQVISSLSDIKEETRSNTRVSKEKIKNSAVKVPVKEFFSELKRAVARQEFDAKSKLNEYRIEVIEAIGQVDFKNLEQALNQFEYQQAMTILDDIKTKIEGR